MLFAQFAGQCVKGGEHTLTRVYERDVVDCKGRVVLLVTADSLRSASYPEYNIETYITTIQKIPTKKSRNYIKPSFVGVTK